jgi:hypothetical protein
MPPFQKADWRHSRLSFFRPPTEKHSFSARREDFTGVTAMMFLGYPALGYLAMRLDPIHAATAIWLIVNGHENVIFFDLT